MKGRSWRYDLLIVVFLIFQAADGLLTYFGVKVYDNSERNPIIAIYIELLGLAFGILAVKLFAVACSFVLHLQGKHGWLLSLTIIYLVGALMPWVFYLQTAN